MIIVRTQAIRGKSMRRVVDSGKVSLAKQCVVLLRFHTLPKTFFPTQVMGVIVVLMDSQNNTCHIDYWNAYRPDLPEEPVVISRPPDSEGGHLLVQQPLRKYEIINPLRRPKPAALASHGTELLSPVRPRKIPWLRDLHIAAAANHQRTFKHLGQSFGGSEKIVGEKNVRIEEA